MSLETIAKLKMYILNRGPKLFRYNATTENENILIIANHSDLLASYDD
jgi:hypothetical protein